MLRSRPRIVVSRHLPDDVETRALRLFDAHLNKGDQRLDSATLHQLAETADGLLICLTDRLDAESIKALPPGVRIVATFSVGHDHIDLGAARARGLVVTNTPDVLTEATADIALLLMLGAARRATEAQTMLRQGRWGAWTPTGLLGTHVGGKRLGLVGLGRIGRAFAQRARACGMEIHYHGPRRAPRIFKTALITSDSSKTTTFVWRHTAGGWSLAYTTKNSASSSTGYAGFTISGSPLYTDENAVTVMGASSNILGPLIPLSYDGLNIISSTRGSSTGGASAFYYFACSSSGSSASAVWSTSSSDTVSFDLTYAPSRLTGYVNLPACDISTESTFFNSWYQNQGAFNPLIPDISKNAKWNEAGRQDPVAVL